MLCLDPLETFCPHVVVDETAQATEPCIAQVLSRVESKGSALLVVMHGSCNRRALSFECLRMYVNSSELWFC